MAPPVPDSPPPRWAPRFNRAADLLSDEIREGIEVVSEESEDDDPILEALDAFLRARPAWHTFEAAVREIPSSHFQTLVRSQLRSGLGTEVFVKHRKAEAGMEEADVADVQQGWDPKTISERLGHYKPSFTMDRYAHVTQARHEEVADRLEAFAPTGTGGATVVPIRQRKR